MSFETLQPNANEQREYIRHAIKQFELFREETFRNMWINFERGIIGTYAMPKEGGQSYELIELKFYKAKGWDTQKVSDFLTDNPQYTQAEPTPTPSISKQTLPVSEANEMLKRIKQRMVRRD